MRRCREEVGIAITTKHYDRTWAVVRHEHHSSPGVPRKEAPLVGIGLFLFSTPQAIYAANPIASRALEKKLQTKIKYLGCRTLGFVNGTHTPGFYVALRHCRFLGSKFLLALQNIIQHETLCLNDYGVVFLVWSYKVFLLSRTCPLALSEIKEAFIIQETSNLDGWCDPWSLIHAAPFSYFVSVGQKDGRTEGRFPSSSSPLFLLPLLLLLSLSLSSLLVACMHALQLLCSMLQQLGCAILFSSLLFYFYTVGCPALCTMFSLPFYF